MKAREKRRRRKLRKARQRARLREVFRAAIDAVDERFHDGAIFPKWLKVEPMR